MRQYEASNGRRLLDVFSVALHRRLTLPREFILIARQLVLFEGYSRMVAPDLNIFAEPDIVTYLFEGLIDARVVARLPEILGRVH